MSNKINPRILLQKSCTSADIYGSNEYPQLHGRISFYKVCQGSIVVAEIYGLPSANGIYAMHIHNGTACTGNETDPFANSGSHLNLAGSVHPYHTGDLPPLFSSGGGYAWLAVYTDRFTPDQIRGYTVIIHSNPDDFHTQPSGNPGTKIACGIIK